MNPRQTWLWLLLAAVLFGLVLARSRYFHSHESGPVKVVPNLNASAVESIEITLTNSAELRAERAGSGWTLSKPLSYPAQAANIDALLARLERLTPATS